MELWVRSQDKKLLEKVSMIKCRSINDKYGIVVNCDYIYAEYATEQRALEVMQEIHDVIRGYATVQHTGKIYNSFLASDVIVFDFPEV